MSALQVTWFLLIGGLLTVYAILDGFDLGVGFWHLFTKKDNERRNLLKSIGPVWDGNEVWLLTGGGAIFAAFPPVYASVFSGLYLAVMFLLFALILRAVSIEFRSKVEAPGWRKTWDLGFGCGSSLAALLFGVALGNLLRGLPLDESGNFTGTFFSLLNPYALLIGLVGFGMLATHGALYIRFRTDGDLSTKARGWALKSWVVYLVLFCAAVIATIATQGHLLDNYLSNPVLWLIPAVSLASLAMIGIFTSKDKPKLAFVASSLSIASMMGLAGAAMFPNLVPALNASELSLTVFNSSSSELTLQTMLILALIGMPFVVAYTILVYRAFGSREDATADNQPY
jgi:cytochrome bd ubiquinol oxidase subunit II